MVVNVVGSFVIGFFGTLTGADGRFLVAPDVRTFVMVGFCGGYTTFSSFSLQTLALARDGEWLQVGANVLALGRPVPGLGLARPRRGGGLSELPGG